MNTIRRVPEKINSGLNENINNGVISKVVNEIEPQRKSTVWIVHNILETTELDLIIDKVSSCSKVINLIVEPLNHLEALEKYKLDHPKLEIIFFNKAIEQAKIIDAKIDPNYYLGWQPILTENLNTDQINHLSEVYHELTPLMNRKAMSKITRNRVSSDFIKNALVNAVFTNSLNSFANYKYLHKDKPVVIISTGPSLNKQLSTLQKYKDFFITISVDASVKILHEAGIIPDYIVTLDPGKRPYWGTNELDEKSTVFLDLGSCPDLAWTSTKNYVITDGHPDVTNFINSLGTDIPFLNTGGSVSTRAFNIALHLGCNPIVMIGQDLGWTEGKHHAEGYVSQYTQESLDARHANGFEIEGYYGGTVRTEKQLMVYKTWFEEKITTQPETIVINSTEGGALIKGAANIPFITVCEEISKYPILKDTIPTRPWAIDIEYVSNLQNSLVKLNSELVDLKNNIIQVIDKINKNTKTKRSNERILTSIDKLNKILVSSSQNVKIIIEMMEQSEIASQLQQIHATEFDQEIVKILSGYLNLYNATLSGIDSAAAFVDKIIKLHREIIDRQKLTFDLLYQFNLNKWNADGSKNKSY